MNKLIALAFVFATACTVPFDSPASIRIEAEDETQFFEFRELVTIAIDNWHIALNEGCRTMPFTMDENGKYPVVLKYYWPEGYEYNAGLTENYGDGNGHVYIRQRLTETIESDYEMRLHTTMHELGHLMNLDHSDNPSDLMYGGRGHPTLEITENDIAMAKDSIGCDY